VDRTGVIAAWSTPAARLAGARRAGRSLRFPDQPGGADGFSGQPPSDLGWPGEAGSPDRPIPHAVADHPPNLTP